MSGAEHTGHVSDLFSDAADERVSELAPLAARLRPEQLEDFVGQEDVVGPGSALARAIAEDRVGSAVFYGPPGSGKTTLARIVAGRHGGGVRGAVRRVRIGRGRARGARAGEGAAGRGRAPHDPLPGRDPPLQQGAAGCPPARGRVGPPDADRGDDGESVLRGQLGAALAHAGLRAPAARPRRAGRDHPARRFEPRRRGLRRAGRPHRGEGGRRRPLGPQHPRAGLVDGAVGGSAARGAARRGRGPAPAGRLRQGRRRPLRLHLGLHQVDPRLRPERSPLLPRGHAGGRRGSALHRAAPDRPRLRGHRHGRLTGTPRRRGGRPRGRARRASRGAAQPGPRHHLPRQGAEVERCAQGHRRRTPRRPRAWRRSPAQVAAGHPLPRVEEARPRRGLRLSAQRPVRLRRRLPPGGAPRPPLLRAPDD